MILLDHNIPEDQVQQLRSWQIRFKQVGYEIGRPEWKDLQEIRRYLHRSKHPTFFTRDLGFFRRRLCHGNYCAVVVTGHVLETAWLIRRFLRYPQFRTKAKRRGKIVKLSRTGIVWWERGRDTRMSLGW